MSVIKLKGIDLDTEFVKENADISVSKDWYQKVNKSGTFETSDGNTWHYTYDAHLSLELVDPDFNEDSASSCMGCFTGS